MGNSASQQTTTDDNLPKVGDVVNTQFGPGKVESYREEDNVFVVVLRWQLAEKNKAYAYLQADSLTKRPSQWKQEEPAKELYAPGTFVETPQGVAMVLSYRADDCFYVVEYQNWLTDGQTAKGFHQPSQIKQIHRARKGQFVITPYGTGVMSGVRKDGIHVVRIKQMEGGAIAYLPADAVHRKIKAYVSAVVQTPFGTGTVTAYRPEDDMYAVQLEFAVSYLGPESIEYVGAPKGVNPDNTPATAGGRDREASCIVS